jgi:hypothetical protein
MAQMAFRSRSTGSDSGCRKRQGSESPFELHGFHEHPGCALAVESQFFGGAGTQIDDAALDKGAAVVDPQDDLALVFQVGDAHEGGQGQIFV